MAGHTDMVRDLNNCPALAGHARQRASQANIDAGELAADVRDLDPKVIWGRMQRWLDTNPQRLLAAMISLAAMVDPDQHHWGVSPKWTLPIGGTASLHPDYNAAPVRIRGRLEEHRTQIIDLAGAGLSDEEIARRVGIGVKSVARVRLEAGVKRPRGSHHQRDKKIAELAAAGMSTKGIAAALGCSERTVERAQHRIEERGAVA